MIIITGGLGYIGTRLVENLSKDNDIIIIDKMLYHVDDKFFDSIKNTKIMPYDAFDSFDFIRDNKKDIDVIINLAAIVGEDACKKDTEQAIFVNYKLACDLSSISSINEIPFIQMSTCSNYGLVNEEVDENSILMPTNLYAETKVNAENYILNTNRHAIILRSATAYGLSYRMRFDLLLNEWVKDAYLHKRVEVYDPYAYRPLIHVKDIANAIRLIVDKIRDNVKLERIYNLGSNNQNYIKQMIARAIAEELNADIEYIERRESRSYKVRFDRIRNLGFTPRYTIENGINEIIYALDNNIFDLDDIKSGIYANA